jgi:hypothetical protein
VPRLQRLPIRDGLAVVQDREADGAVGERVATHRLEAMAELGGIRLQELAPRRHRLEELSHLHRRADTTRDGRELAARRVEPRGVRRTGDTARDRDLSDRCDGGQRLAPEAQARHAFELCQRADLACRVAAEGERQFVGGDAAAVVFDEDGAHASGGEMDRDPRRAGIERVVDELPDDGGRALDDLAGCDLAHQRIGQRPDGPAHGVR